MTVSVSPRTFLIAALLAATSLTVQAQQVPVFEAEANLMEIEVRVTDGRGQAVAGLSKEDFQLLEDGKPQEIATFEFVTRPIPRSQASDEDTSPVPVVTDPHAAANELRRSTFIYIATRGRREDMLRECSCRWKGLRSPSRRANSTRCSTRCSRVERKVTE